jgi:hypothetical protein
MAGARQCRSDDECGDARRCEFGHCADGKRQCFDDDDCGEGRCEFGACMFGVRECYDDADCGPGLTCDSGRCRELSTAIVE